MAAIKKSLLGTVFIESQPKKPDRDLGNIRSMQQPAGTKLANVIVGRVDKYPTKIRGVIPGFFVSYKVLWKLMRSYKNRF